MKERKELVAGQLSILCPGHIMRSNWRVMKCSCLHDREAWSDLLSKIEHVGPLAEGKRRRSEEHSWDVEE